MLCCNKSLMKLCILLEFTDKHFVKDYCHIKKKILLKHVYEVYNVDNIILKMFLNLFKHVLV